AYSSKSCPSSRRRTTVLTMRFNLLTIGNGMGCAPQTQSDSREPERKKERGRPGMRRPLDYVGLRRRRELSRDAREDVVHADAGRADGTDGHERDQRHEQRVLEQVLALFLAHERLHVVQKHRHEILPRGNVHRRLAMRVCGSAALFVMCAALAASR